MFESGFGVFAWLSINCCVKGWIDQRLALLVLGCKSIPKATDASKGSDTKGLD
jgi:hypothetical protein